MNVGARVNVAFPPGAAVGEVRWLGLKCFTAAWPKSTDHLRR